MSRVELYERIRKDNREGLSIRALAAKHHVHRRSVREALASAVPPERRTPERVSPALGPWTLIIRAWLVADRDAPRKQRHTARRVHQRLVAEYGAQVAESTVRAYVAQVNFELDNTLRVVTVPQSARPGRGGRVRFRGVHGLDRRGAGEVLDVLPASEPFGARVPRGVLPPGAGGVLRGPRARPSSISVVCPALIRYDNLKSAVVKVLLGRDRLENERFVALRSHYGFDSFYCLPGIEGSPREGRRGGRGRPVPPPSPGPGPPGGEPRRAQRADRGG